MLLIPLFFARVGPADPARPDRIDDAYVRSLAARKTLWPQEATVLLAWEMKGLRNVSKGIPEATVAQIDAVVNRVSWPDREHIGAFTTFVNGVPELLEDSDESRAYAWAMPLVCAAWDLQMGRRQFVDWVAGVVCADPQATLLGGRRNEICSTLSPDWPWRKTSGRFALRPAALPPVPGGATGLTSGKYVLMWDAFDRDQRF